MDGLLQIDKTTINLGLKKEYKIFQISDAHISYTDEKSSQIDLDDNKRSHIQWNQLKVEFAEQFEEFRDEKYDIEAHLLLEKLMQYAEETSADAIVFSGDIMDRVTDSNIRYLKGKISKCSTKVIYCPGNHAHHDEYGVHRNMYERFEGLISNPEFDVFDFEEFKVITVDNGTKNITDNQILRLEQELNKDKKILLVLHAPIKLGEFGKVMGEKICDYFLLSKEDGNNQRKFIELIENNDEKFIAVLAGHIHGAVEYPITEKLNQYTTSSALIGKAREITIKWGEKYEYNSKR